MKRSGILNAELARAIASLGHGDGLLVVDAGFPIPSDAWRIDLAVARDVPDLTTVLSLVAAEMIVEGLVVAEDVATHNQPLQQWLRSTWPDVEPTLIEHREMLDQGAKRAKAVVRTGAFEPWGNVLLISGVDVAAFFSRPGVVVPDYYRDRIGGKADV
ncbi:MAG: D-ribose pyranase [Ilumatobacteraceae bacterium]